MPLVEHIDEYAFNSCTALSEVSIPNTMSIADSTFGYCAKLELVDFGAGPRDAVAGVESLSFEDTPPCRIVVPDSLYDAWTAPHDGWTAVKLAADARALDTRGTLVYAYARGNYTANGIAFMAAPDNTGIDNANCTMDITHGASNIPPSDIAAGGYRDILSLGWYASAATRTLTLRNLV